ncbi:MAG: transcription-repair coupling factor [Chloroflexota bacterium]|nr:transcription-repair coupling factor [Chloroflexota bacterium]
MDLSALLPLVDETVGLDRLRSRMRDGAPLMLGVSDGAKAAVLAALARDATAPLLVIVPRPQHADALVDELAAWLGDEGRHRVLHFPERDPLPYERLAPDPDDATSRLQVLDALAASRSAATDAPLPIVVACAAAIAQRTLTPDELTRSTVAVTRGAKLSQPDLLRALDAGGYRIEAQVTAPGDASRRGGIVDVWPPPEDLPLRIELFGDEVESIRSFDATTQRSEDLRDSVRIGPARELIVEPGRMRRLAERMQISGLRGEQRERLERDVNALLHGEPLPDETGRPAWETYTPFLTDATLLDHLPAEALIVVDEPADLTAVQRERDDQAREARLELELRGEIAHGMPEPHVLEPELQRAIDAHPRRLSLSRWATGDAEAAPADASDAATVVRLPFGPVAAYGGRLRVLAEELTPMLRRGQQVIIVSTQSKRLAELLEEHDIFARIAETMTEPQLGRGALTVMHGALPHGWAVGEEGAGLTLLTDAEVFGFSKQRRAPPRRGTARETFLADLVPGEYVVHVEHGIAKFAGLSRKGIDGQEREYLELQYADGDRLFVPSEQVDRVSRYVGPSEHRPSLTRLGSQEWPRAKARVRRAVQELAKELLQLYAAREVAEGYAFPTDTAWQTELEASFPYVETPDQASAIRDVKHDMEDARPMDRLVCGDVGYGKTEVAVRAAFKAVMEGMQVAVLVPTTVLAQQHFNTFRQRLAGFPVKVEMLSRFRSDKEQHRIAADAATGNVDIVIGTHRLLQKDVAFKNLGLIVIDEEQRFGVAHKERLKKMRAEVDVLTLTATPIPRTLNMALAGIRDMSTIETPPEERLPIKTYVTEFDDHLVREAITRELERGGQVYFVHNRVHNIELIARQLRDTAPDADILIGHGQMPEDQLENVMFDFTEGKADVLVCTTIIESGLDIPNVNTIIINNADKFGLAQLYQLRGRVGRGAARAYAYLLYEKHHALSEVAQKRLQTIFEATELGAGFQIALRDLEIRGAGNLLGAEQSGQIGTVGFDLYVKLLADAVEGLKALAKGEPPPPSSMQPPVVIDVPLAAFIPESYIGDLNLRLSLYQRMASAGDRGSRDGTHRDEDIAADLERELSDRFGPLPTPVRNLLYIVRLRMLAKRARVATIAREEAPGGPPVLSLRTIDGHDFRSQMTASERAALERSGAVTIGHAQMRIDLEAAAGDWRDLLVRALEAAAAPEADAVAATA